jgi:hypothetical protein
MPTPVLNAKCYACGKPANYSILLAITGGRLYLPNQSVRESVGTGHPHTGLQEVPFCSGCMRHVEDALRATVLYLQSENGVSPPKEA